MGRTLDLQFMGCMFNPWPGTIAYLGLGLGSVTKLGTEQRAVTFWSSEGNCRFGVALAMRHRHSHVVSSWPKERR